MGEAVFRPCGKGRSSTAHRLFRICGVRPILGGCPGRAPIAAPKRRGRAKTGALPKDLYAYAKVRPLPRIGRPPKLESETWTVTDDWPDPLPVTQAEIDLFEAWFGDVFDELFGPSS